MTTITDSPLFQKVRDTFNEEEVYLVAWDGCHKMYLAMDQIEADWFRNEYPYIVQGEDDNMLAALGEWWEESCALRFISAVRHDDDDPNAGFVRLIEQFDDEEEEEEEEEE